MTKHFEKYVFVQRNCIVEKTFLNFMGHGYELYRRSITELGLKSYSMLSYDSS